MCVENPFPNPKKPKKKEKKKKKLPPKTKQNEKKSLIHFISHVVCVCEWRVVRENKIQSENPEKKRRRKLIINSRIMYINNIISMKKKKRSMDTVKYDPFFFLFFYFLGLEFTNFNLHLMISWKETKEEILVLKWMEQNFFFWLPNAESTWRPREHRVKEFRFDHILIMMIESKKKNQFQSDFGIPNWKNEWNRMNWMKWKETRKWNVWIGNPKLNQIDDDDDFTFENKKILSISVVVVVLATKIWKRFSLFFEKNLKL